MFVAVDSARLFFDVDGAKLVPDGPRMRERPTLVLLHGGPGFDHSTFKPAFGRLAASAQLVYVDQRGQGRSSRCPAEERTLSRWADDVPALCAALGIASPVVVGHSFGAFVALTYAARHPGHARGMVVSGATGRLRFDRAAAELERRGGPQAGEAARQFFDRPGPEAHEAYERLCQPHYSPLEGDPDVAVRGVRAPDVLFEFFAAELRRMDLRPGLALARSPVLVVHGAEDPIVAVDEAEELVAALPAGLGRLEVVASAGHTPYRDRADAYFSAVEAFLRDLG
jgi:proline iminopeptidase